jgi:hypothetical protein
MSDCDCCGCDTEGNYRGQRVKPTSVTFASWCNTSTNFFDVENNAIGSSTLASRADDAGGPTHLVSGAGWVPISGFESNIKAYGGSLTLHGIYGNTYQVTVAPNTQAIASSRAIAITAFEETASIESGILVDPLFINGDATQLTFNGDSLVGILYGPSGNATLPLSIEFASSTGLSDDSGEPGIITARVPAGGRIDGAFGLPWPQGQITQPFTLVPSVTPTHYVFWGYFNTPMKLEGSKCSLYRDGELVWEVTRPAIEDSIEHTSEDGVYVWVSEVSEASDPPWTGNGTDNRTREPSPLMRVASFVVDTEAAVVGASAPNDFFVDDPDKVTGQRPYFVATKPIRTRGTSFPMYVLQADSGNSLVRPIHAPRLGSAPNLTWYHEASDKYVNAAGISGLKNLGVGSYTVTPAFAGSEVDDFIDFPGNEVSGVPTFSLQIHAVPNNDRRGSRPLLEDVGLQTREYGRARLQTEKVQAVKLRFDRKVDASGVNADQITLTKDGEPVAGCTMSQLNDVEWLITLPPEADQTPKSFWVLEYDPGGDVMTDDIDEQSYGSLAAFPPLSQSVYRRVYVAANTGLRYSKSPTQYVPIGVGPPTDANGVAFEPEPSVLAARVSWLMASANGWLAPLDTSSTTLTIGTTASISKELEEMPQPDGTFKIESTGGVIANWGQTRKGIETDGFTPQVPPQSDSPDDCSFWGLTTTIDPCPPKTLRCPVAKAPQRHASVIRMEEDLPSFKATLSVPGSAAAGVTLNLFNQASDGSTPQNTWRAEIEEDLKPHEASTFQAGGALPAQGQWGSLYQLNDGTKHSWSSSGWQQVTDGKAIAPDGGGFPPVGLVSGVALATACRNASQYAALETAFLWELEIYFEIRRIFRGVDAPSGQVVDSQSVPDRHRVVLSRDKEDEWNESGSVSIPLGGVVWTFEPAE